MSYTSKNNSNVIGLISTTVHARAVVTHWTEGEKERWPMGVRAVGLEDMEALAEELHSDKTPDDCAAFLSLLHQHAGAAVFRACAALRAKVKPADRNAALARLCERVMDGRFEQEALQTMAAVDPQAALAAAVETKKTTRSGGGGGAKCGRPPGSGKQAGGKKGGGGGGGGGKGAKGRGRKEKKEEEEAEAVPAAKRAKMGEGEEGKAEHEQEEEEGGQQEQEFGQQEEDEVCAPESMDPEQEEKAEVAWVPAGGEEKGQQEQQPPAVAQEGEHEVAATAALSGDALKTSEPPRRHLSAAAVDPAVMDGEEVYVDKEEDWVACA